MSESKSSSDILMKFVHNGRAIHGDSTAEIAPPNRSPHRMMKGFHKHHMFEIDSFTFAMTVQGATPGTNPQGTQQQGGMYGAGQYNQHGQMWHNGQPQYWPGHPGTGQMGPGGTPRPSSIGQFKAWRAGGKADYPISIQPITFTRGVDRTSTILMHHLFRTEGFDSATLVKRKAAGGNIAGEPFLRLDFSSVLITDMSWSNNEPVQETCKFISRAITVRYRPQLPDGSLGAIIQKFYPMNVQEHEEIL